VLDVQRAAGRQPGAARRRAARREQRTEPGDITAVGLDYKALENKLLAAIHVRFGLHAQLPDDLNVLIKRADKASAYFEATQLAGFSVEEALEFFGSPRGLRQVKLVPLAARDAQAAYVARFNELLPSPSDS
jgi:hypothetical protein